MAEKPFSPVVASQERAPGSAQEHELSAQITAQVTMALSALDGHYKENIAAYADALHACVQEIEEARSDLAHLEASCVPHRTALERVEKEVDHAVRMLEYLNEQWIQKALVLSELESELTHLSYAPSEGDAMIERRQQELKRDLEEIENLELTLLQHELDKQNLLLVIEPIERKIAAVQKRITSLEAKKRYIESAHLHRITQVGTPLQLSSKER